MNDKVLRGCGSHAGQIFENLIEQAVEGCPKRGGAMPKMVIEVPEQFAEVGKAMAEHLAMLQRTVDRLGGGKAVDYAAVGSGDRGRGVQDRISSPQSNLEESGR